jgi:hypothetical protein
MPIVLPPKRLRGDSGSSSRPRPIRAHSQVKVVTRALGPPGARETARNPRLGALDRSLGRLTATATEALDREVFVISLEHATSHTVEHGLTR